MKAVGRQWAVVGGLRKVVCVSLVFIFHFSFFNSVRAQELPLSEGAKASVITCGVGDDFYTSFGHSAIRICDSAQGIDWVYNYGTFDWYIRSSPK